MLNKFKKLLRDPIRALKRLAHTLTKKQSHTDSWKTHVEMYQDWYDGKLSTMYGTPSPSQDEKIVYYDKKTSAILTWFEKHQKTKYAHDLQLSTEVFKNKKIADIGSGPYPNCLVFEDCEVYSIDPLLPNYLEMGFPLHAYDKRAKFIYGHAEKIPVPDKFFDAIISVNAIDHVDDIKLAAKEIQRVLKPNGLFAMHVHYHKKTANEPIEINDNLYKELFSWCNGLKKITESNDKFGWHAPSDEKYCLWRNF